MKKIIYVLLFIILGILLQFIIHAAIEVTYIQLLIKNFDVYGLGLSWDTWFMINHVFAMVLLVGGIVFGWHQGEHWYHHIYEKRR